MIFSETKLGGAFVIELEPERDERGFFARTFCQREFSKRGLASLYVQSSVSFNHRRGTLRGMHYEAEPHNPAKLVRCTAGSIYDVILDLRCDSPTWLQWSAVELSAGNRRVIYVPKGFAHGFQTLTDDTEVHYEMSEFYVPEASRGVRWNDPCLRMVWPQEPTLISERDRTYADFDPSSFEV